MVIVRIIGGLGNQLFQYAAGRQLAQRLNTPLKLDVTAYKHYPLRCYKLAHFSIKANLTRSYEVATLNPEYRCRFVTPLGGVIRRMTPSKQRIVLREDMIGPVRREVLEAAGDVYLSGYWQSEKYFATVATLIRREFSVKSEPDARNQEMAARIMNCNAVSLHVRRGDYVINPDTNRLHGVCEIDYYQSCVKELVKHVSQPHFFVFSDDPEWVRNNLQLSYPATLIAHNGAAKDFEDLRLMSLCQHHIIANSSFSWWGAWLGRNPDKWVFAPRRWFRDAQIDTSDLIPAGWVRV